MYPYSHALISNSYASCVAIVQIWWWWWRWRENDGDDDDDDDDYDDDNDDDDDDEMMTAKFSDWEMTSGDDEHTDHYRDTTWTLSQAI